MDPETIITNEEDLLEYFHLGARPRERFGIGVEYERLGVFRETGRAIPYEGDASVETILRTLATRGWTPRDESGQIMAPKLLADVLADLVAGVFLQIEEWFLFSVASIRQRLRNGGSLPRDDGADAFFCVVALDLANGHERSKGVEDVLVKGGASEVNSEPMDRTGVVGCARQIGAVLIRASDFANGNSGPAFEGQDDQVIDLDACYKGPDLADLIDDTSGFVVGMGFSDKGVHVLAGFYG